MASADQAWWNRRTQRTTVHPGSPCSPGSLDMATASGLRQSSGVFGSGVPEAPEFLSPVGPLRGSAGDAMNRPESTGGSDGHPRRSATESQQMLRAIFEDGLE